MTKLRGVIHHIYEHYFSSEERTAYQLWQTKPTFHYTPEFIYGLLVASRSFICGGGLFDLARVSAWG